MVIAKIMKQKRSVFLGVNHLDFLKFFQQTKQKMLSVKQSSLSSISGRRQQSDSWLDEWFQEGTVPSRFASMAEYSVRPTPRASVPKDTRGRTVNLVSFWYPA